jgi:ribokinase
VDVVVVGSANLDVVIEVADLPRPGQTCLALGRREGPGGKGLNQAIAAARAGATAALLAAAGRDPAREVLLAELDAAAVDTTWMRSSDTPTGTALVFVDSSGENTIVVDPGANAGLADLSRDELSLVEQAAVVLCQLESPTRTVATALGAAQGLAVLNAAPASVLSEDLLRRVDVLVVNQHEALQAAGAPHLDAAMAALLRLVPEVVVTLGPDGALVGARDRPPRRVPGQQARAVVDTTGAGDTFCGAFAAARARGADSAAATWSAVCAATLSVERPGAARSVPTRDEVLARWPDA